MAKVTVMTGRRTMTVDAPVVDRQWACTPCVNAFCCGGRRYRVTHVPSGLAIPASMLSCDESEFVIGVVHRLAREAAVNVSVREQVRRGLAAQQGKAMPMDHAQDEIRGIVESAIAREIANEE